MWIRTASLQVLTIALSLGGHAMADTLTLRKTVELALHHNPELAASRARVDLAEAGLRQAEGARLPRVTLSLSATRTNDALAAFGLKLGQERISAADFDPVRLNNPNAINNLNTRIEVMAPIYTGGQIAARQDEARAWARAAREGVEASRQELLMNVLKAYQSVHLARAYIQVSEQARVAAAEFLRVSENLHKQGMAVRADVLAARVNLDDARLRLAEAKRLEADALDQLKLLLGRDLGESIDVDGEFLPSPPTEDAATLRARALAEHPALKALRGQNDATRSALEAARGAKKPQFNVMARHDWNDKNIGMDAASYTIAGVLSWTAFDGGLNDAAIDRAQATSLEHAAKLRQAEDGIVFQVTEARRRALEAETRVEVREAAVLEAEEAQRLTKRRYENGITTLTDLLSAQAQLDKTRADLARARYDRAVSRGEVLRAAGMLTQEQL
jgi:outer membrane protein TolC